MLIGHLNSDSHPSAEQLPFLFSHFVFYFGWWGKRQGLLWFKEMYTSSLSWVTLKWPKRGTVCPCLYSLDWCKVTSCSLVSRGCVNRKFSVIAGFFILVSEKSEGCPSFWRITMRTVCYSPCCLVGSIQSFAFIRDIDKIRPSHTCAHKPVHRCLQTFFLQRATATSVILDKPHFLWVEKEYPCVFSVNDLTAA